MTEIAVPTPRRRLKPAPVEPTTKAALVRDLLARPRGATQAEVSEATRWLPHTVRAHLSGLRKRGHMISKTARKDGETAYRLERGA